MFLIFIPLGYLLGCYRSFHAGQLLKEFFGLADFHNVAWWYVRQYIVMLLLLPVIDLSFDFIAGRKKMWQTVLVSFVIAVTYSAAGCLIFLRSQRTAVYLMIFAIGYCCARYRLFSVGDGFFKTHKLLRYSVGAGMLLLCVSVRVLLSDYAAYCVSDIFIAPLFIYAVCLLTKEEGNGTKAFARLGQYSVYMWLTHMFFCSIFYELTVFSKISTVIYLQFVAMTLLTAMALTKLETVLIQFWRKGKKEGRFLCRKSK